MFQKTFLGLSTSLTRALPTHFPSTGALSLCATRTYSSKRTPRFLITGALGQLGYELSRVLRSKYGKDNVLMTDIRKPSAPALFEEGPFCYANINSYETLERIVVEYNLDTIIHLSSLLSVVAEQNPQQAIKVNIEGLHNIFEVARKNNLKVFAPSSISAFGLTTPQDLTPDVTIQRPNTIYGISKVYLEMLGEWYNQRYGIDFRSLRYPGVISSLFPPGGGTTDYAIDMLENAVIGKNYNCYLREDSALPMIHMTDCLNATVKFLEVPEEQLKRRVYNITAISFTPKELYEEILKHVPDFKVSYSPDFRQRIADSWPNSLDDSNARKDWNWGHKIDLARLVSQTLQEFKQKHNLN